MKSNQKLTTSLVNWAAAEPLITHVALVGDRINNAAVLSEYEPYECLLATEDPKGALSRVDWAAIFSDAVVMMTDPQALKIFYILDRMDRIILSLVTPQQLSERLAEDTLCEVAIDKDHRFGARPHPTDLSHRIKRPEQSEYDSWCTRFFAEMSSVCFYLIEDKLIAAQEALGRARLPLMAMTKAAASANADFTVTFGRDVQNIKVYIDDIWYDHFQRTYAETSKDALWDALFQGCMLFRKAGMQLEEQIHYGYPRKADTDMMQVFRLMWEANR